MTKPGASEQEPLPSWMTHRRMVEKCKDCGGPMLWQNERFRTLMCPNCVMERCEKAEATVREQKKDLAGLARKIADARLDEAKWWKERVHYAAMDAMQDVEWEALKHETRQRIVALEAS